MIKSQETAVIALAFAMIASPAYTDFFHYTDASGTVVIVDDESKVPAKYRKQMQTTTAEKDEPIEYTSVMVKNNKVLVPVTFSYRGTTVAARLLLDTGASMTTISTDLANRLGIRSVTGCGWQGIANFRHKAGLHRGRAKDET
jgi:predicted aspartyl protease